MLTSRLTVVCHEMLAGLMAAVCRVGVLILLGSAADVLFPRLLAGAVLFATFLARGRARVHGHLTVVAFGLLHGRDHNHLLRRQRLSVRPITTRGNFDLLDALFST